MVKGHQIALTVSLCAFIVACVALVGRVISRPGGDWALHGWHCVIVSADDALRLYSEEQVDASGPQVRLLSYAPIAIIPYSGIIIGGVIVGIVPWILIWLEYRRSQADT